MELRIDLSDVADIEAAHALLATILGRSTVEIHSSGVTNITAVEFNGTNAGTLPNPPAELVGGNLDAPSTAGASTLPSVPGALLAGGQDSTNVATPGAPTAPGSGAPTDSAPVAPAATVDSEGLAWDARIHSKPPTINKSDGKFRAKRALSEVESNAIKAQIRAVMAIPTPGAAPGATAPAAAPTAPPVPPVTVPVSTPTAPVSPPAPVAPPVAAPAQPDPTTFQELMPRITAGNAAGVLPQSALLDACTAYQLPNIPALAQRPDLVPYVWVYLRNQYPTLA